LFSIPNPEQI